MICINTVIVYTSLKIAMQTLPHTFSTLKLLTLGAHAPEGYSSCPVCVSVCLSVCLSATLIWGLGLVEV